MHIHNRKHRTIPELIVPASDLIYRHKTCLLKYLIIIALAAQILVQIITVLVRVTKPELLHCLIGQLSLFEILMCPLSSRSTKQHIKILCSLFIYLKQLCAPVCLPPLC